MGTSCICVRGGCNGIVGCMEHDGTKERGYMQDSQQHAGDASEQRQIVRLYADGDVDENVVACLEQLLGTNALHEVPVQDGDPMLHMTMRGLVLETEGQVLIGDFAKMLPRIAPGRLSRELLVRAARIKHGPMDPTAVDATAGLGEDAFLLAAAGYSVTLYERDPLIASLLWDALRRAAAQDDLAPVVARMHFICGDSIAALSQMQAAPDVVLLDPMFPVRQKSALVKKKLQMLQRLERPCSDEAALLDAALAARPHKIIIKRPIKGPYLADRKPDYSIAGKMVRYDCVVCAAQ